MRGLWRWLNTPRTRRDEARICAVVFVLAFLLVLAVGFWGLVIVEDPWWGVSG